MIRQLMSACALVIAAPAAAQLSTESRTVITPVAQPGMSVTQVAPDAYVVTPVPGVAVATKIKVQRFGDYDLDRDRVYSPMEFAQAAYFLATTAPAAGNPKLPARDGYMHKGAPHRMKPSNAVTLLNATADEFTAIDMNNDWRVSPEELAAAAML